MEMKYRDKEEGSSLDLLYLDMVWMNGHLGLAKTSLLVTKVGNSSLHTPSGQT